MKVLNSILYESRLRKLPIVSVITLLFLMSLTTFGSQAKSFPDVIIPVPHPMTSLLHSEIIHKELELSAAQITEVEKIISQFEQPLWRLRDLPLQERNDKAAPLIMQLKERLSQVLSTRQLERLNHLVLQAKGVDAVLEPQVIDALELSPEQIQGIRELLSASHNQFASLQNEIGRGSEAQRWARLMRLQSHTQRSISNILNGHQQRTYKKLYGSVFGDLQKVPNIACPAPEIETNTWLNSSPVKLSELRGKVTVVHFYTFGCVNCIRNLPHYNDWQKTFNKEQFQIIGIHRPEMQYERDIEKVKAKAAEAGMNYPITVDNDSRTWDSYANNVWPSIYIIDKNGFIRYWWYGELNWQGAKTEKYLRSKIRELIEEP